MRQRNRLAYSDVPTCFTSITTVSDDPCEGNSATKRCPSLANAIMECGEDLQPRQPVTSRSSSSSFNGSMKSPRRAELLRLAANVRAPSFITSSHPSQKLRFASILVKPLATSTKWSMLSAENMPTMLQHTYPSLTSTANDHLAMHGAITPQHGTAEKKENKPFFMSADTEGGCRERHKK